MRFITPEKPIPVDRSEARTILVIAAGLGRCATSSLHYAFENTLGLAPTMHYAYVVPSVERLKLNLAALNQTDKEKRVALLYQLFDGRAATTDTPGSAFVDDLMDMYPSAKLVLNKRGRAEDWVDSMKMIQWFSSKFFLAINYWNPTAKLHYEVSKAVRKRRSRVLGLDCSSPSVEMYEAHLNWVRELAKARGVSLLEWTADMGYEPLCEFLGKEIPEEPFPRVNDAENVNITKNYMIRRGLLTWAGVMFLLAAPVVASYAWFGV